MKQKRVVLDYQTRDWIDDRVDNEEPLMWNEYIRMMSGADDGIKPSEMNKSELAMIDKLKSKEYKEAVRYEYFRQKYYFMHNRWPMPEDQRAILRLQSRNKTLIRHAKRKRASGRSSSQAKW